jgi:hypothetical protein
MSIAPAKSTIALGSDFNGMRMTPVRSQETPRIVRPAYSAWTE